MAAAGVSTAVAWASSAPQAATVSTSGVVTAVARGTATMTATSTANSTVNASTLVTVNDPTVRSITLSPLSTTLFPGSTRQLVATVDADVGANSGLAWTSADPAIATVSNSGVVSGVGIGRPVTIIARSLLVNAVFAATQITVSAAPSALQFTLGRLGSGNVLGGIGTWTASSASASDAIVGLGTQGGGGGTYRNTLLQRNAGGWRDISPACCGGAGLPIVSASAATNMLISFTGDAFLGGGTPRVFIWNGTALVDANYPSELASREMIAVVATGPGEYLLLLRHGLLYRYAGSTWTRLDSLRSSVSSFPSMTAMVAWHRDSVAAWSCPGGAGNRLIRWTPSGQTLIPLPPSGTTDCGDISGVAGDDLASATSTALAMWNGTAWNAISAALLPGEVLRESAACGSERYAVSSGGNVYQRAGNTLVRIATNGEVVAQSEFGVSPKLDCARDGTVRVASGDGLIVRRDNGSWSEENYAPNFTRAHLARSTVGFLVGNGVVHRWNGAQWQRIRRVARPSERYEAVAAFSRGGMIAGGQSERAYAFAVRYNGTSFAFDSIAGYSSITSIAAIGDNRALATARTDVLAPNALLRYDNGWSAVSSGVNNPLAVSSSSPTNAFIVGATGGVARYNGTSFTNLAPLPLVNVAFTPTRMALHTLGESQAFAGSCDAPNPARIWRFTGAAWTDITPTSGGGILCVHDLFGTSMTDMYAIVRVASTGSVSRRLLRWDGTSWMTVSGVPDSGELVAGSAVAGLTILTGSRGYLGTGTPPSAFRKALPRPRRP